MAFVTRLGALAVLALGLVWLGLRAEAAPPPYYVMSWCIPAPDSTSGICDVDSDEDEVYHCVIYRFADHCEMASPAYHCYTELPEYEWTAYECVEEFGECIWGQENSHSESLVFKCSTGMSS